VSALLGPHSTSLWLAFVVGVSVCLAVDLVFTHRRSAAPPLRTALIESAAWIGLALSFDAWLAVHLGAERGIEDLFLLPVRGGQATPLAFEGEGIDSTLQLLNRGRALRGWDDTP
jgi:hypothetical protein